MSNLHLVTGYAGKEHITSADQGSYNAAIMGNGEFILERGNQFSATIVSNNQVRVSDGDIMMQGRHIRMPENTYTDLYFDNGTQGYKRHDLIVVRYEKDASTDIEIANLVVIKGTPSETSPTTPEYTTGDIINEHALLNDLPLYIVPFDGINIQPLKCLFKTVPTIETKFANAMKKLEETIQGFKDADLLDTWKEIAANTSNNKFAGALAAKEMFEKLKKEAFSGSYNDLSNKPAIPAAVAVKGNAESSYRTGNVNLTPANIGALAANGNAASATKLATARTIRTNLASTSTASFDGSANITPGVTGILPVANGGTGNSTGNAATATKATKDSDGNIIKDTYAKKASLEEISKNAMYNHAYAEVIVNGSSSGMVTLEYNHAYLMIIKSFMPNAGHYADVVRGGTVRLVMTHGSSVDKNVTVLSLGTTTNTGFEITVTSISVLIARTGDYNVIATFYDVTTL